MKFLIGAVVFFIPLVAFSQNNSESLSELMSRWIGLESQKGKLQSEWNTREEQLDQKFTLLELERKTLQELLADSQKESSEIDAKRLELLTRQESLEQEQTLISQEINAASKAIQTLMLRLPPPVQAQWQEKIGLLNQKDVNNSEKLERILSLFKLVSEFNDRVALNRATMDIPSADGSQKNILVSQIYLGVSQAWYISDNGDFFGYGRSLPLGWKWWHGSDAETELGLSLKPSDILELRAILQNPTTASYISLPIKLN